MADEEHLKLLNVIFTNILNHPNEGKYRDLNLKRISKKLNNSSAYLEWLYNAGFQVSDNNKRLILHSSKLHQLQETYNTLRLIIDESKHNKLIMTNRVNTYRCRLNDCLSLKIIGNILKCYNKYIQHHQSNESVYDEVLIGNKYDNVKLLNDFNHLLNHHSNEFEDIYDRLQCAVYNDESTCNISKCLLMRRNRRNRSEIAKNENILKQLYFGDDEIVEQQLMDRIHCHFMHTFDIGQITKNEVDTNNKFKSDAKPYSFGIRFFYWNIYKNNRNTWDPCLWQSNFDEANANYTLAQFYVANKYSNFKQELLKNAICHISKYQWLELVKKANHHKQTDLVRNIKYRDNDACYFYDINEQQMTTDHIIAIMVQCNFDQLQRKFTETFRKQTTKETDDSLKQRHSNYHFLAKLLRECVECFGIENKETMSLYHGVNKHFTFKSLKAFIKAPFSATTDRCVAINFCGNQGMILEMKVDATNFGSNSGGAGFECQYFSDFPNEQEIFFIGGSTEFIIKDIIEQPSAKSYKQYIMGLDVITEDMTTGGIRMSTIMYNVLGNLLFLALNKNQLQQLTNERSYMLSVGDRLERKSNSKQMAFRLLADEVCRYSPNHRHAHRFKSCPGYFRNLFHSHCLNVKLVHLNLDNNKLFKLYFYNDKTKWVDFNMVNVVFPNCLRMVCSHHPSSVIVAFESILSFIQSIKNAKLQEIYVPMDITEDIEKYAFNYIHEFASLSWNINVRISNKSNNMLRLFHNTFQSKILEFYQMADIDQSMEEFVKNIQGFGKMFLTEHKCLIITKRNVMHNIYDYYDEDGSNKIRNSWYQRK